MFSSRQPLPSDLFFFFSSRRRHTRSTRDWSSDVCSSDLCLLNAASTWWMSEVTLGVDYWSLAWPRFVQGIGVGFIFVPLNTVALANIAREKMGNATVLLNVVRNLGGGIGVALMATTLARRGQEHQTAMVAHLQTGDPETADRLRSWTAHFAAQGADA